MWLRSVGEVAADPVGAGRAAVGHVRLQADRWWLHVDLDVLDPQAFAAQGLPGVADDPGGLSWQQLTELLGRSGRSGWLHRLEPGHLRPRAGPRRQGCPTHRRPGPRRGRRPAVT